MDTQSERPYIPASQLAMYERCGIQYEFRYLKGIKVAPGVAMVKGIGVHEGSRVNFSQKKTTGVDLPKEQIIGAAVAAFEDGISRGIELTAEEAGVGKAKVVGKAKDGTAILAGLYADNVAPEYQPKFTEERQRIVIPDASHDLVAVMDVADDKGRIVDLKTTGRKKSQAEVDTSEQLSFYALVYKALTGDLPAEVRLEVLVEKAKPERQVLVAQRTMADLTVLLNRLNRMIYGLEKGVFVPAPANSWACDPRWCGYYYQCPFVKREG